MTSPRPIVILGGGFGGLHLVRHLERRLRRGEAEVTLVDRSNYSLFTPLLYQVATGELPPHAIAYPLRVPLAHAGYRFVRSEVEAIDVERRTVPAGLPAWTVWRANYLLQLVGVRNCGTLLVEWLLSYFSRRIVSDIT